MWFFNEFLLWNNMLFYHNFIVTVWQLCYQTFFFTILFFTVCHALSPSFSTSHVFSITLRHILVSAFCFLLSAIFPPVWWLSFVLLLCCQFSQSVAYPTVGICNFITDAPQWQQVQLCMALCFFLISLEILSCVLLWIYCDAECVCV